MLLIRDISDDFDGWVELARRDPDGFERLRRAIIDTAIARAPADRRDRLRGLQWRIDQLRRRADNPIAACISLNRLMWERLAGEHGLLDRLAGDRAGSRTTAEVVSLR